VPLDYDAISCAKPPQSCISGLDVGAQVFVEDNCSDQIWRDACAVVGIIAATGMECALRSTFRAAQTNSLVARTLGAGQNEDAVVAQEWAFSEAQKTCQFDTRIGELKCLASSLLDTRVDLRKRRKEVVSCRAAELPTIRLTRTGRGEQWMEFGGGKVADDGETGAWAQELAKIKWDLHG
jgi:hypothetical protein